MFPHANFKVDHAIAARLRLEILIKFYLFQLRASAQKPLPLGKMAFFFGVGKSDQVENKFVFNATKIRNDVTSQRVGLTSQ